MSKSKGRRLAEWLRNLDTNSQPAGGGIKDGTISTAKLADDAVTSAKIADSAVATAHLADTGVTFGKLHSALVVTESDAISSNDNDTTIATSAAIVDHVATEVAALVDSAPGALNTLNELAAAINDDASFSTTITNSIALKAPLASPALTGTPTAPTASSGTNTTQLATTAFVTAATSGLATDTNLANKAPINNPTFTGTPAAPTASAGTNTTQLATTAFVTTAVSGASVAGISSSADATAITIDSSEAVAIGGSTFIGSRAKSLSVVGDDNSSTVASKTTAYDTVFSVLPWSGSATYIGTGTYYDDGNWVHASDNALASLFVLAGDGAHWYASSGSTVNHDVASNAPLWNSTGQWDGDINTTYDINTGDIASGKVTITSSGYDEHLELNRSSEQWRFSPSTDGSLDIRRIGGTGTAVVDIYDNLNITGTCQINTIAAPSGGWFNVLCHESGVVKADTAVQIHGSGYLKAAYLNMSHAVATRSSDTTFFSSTDDYIRKNNATGFKGSLGIGTSDTPTFAGIARDAHHTGHLVGSYNSVGANSYKSNPIYTIGSSYNPSDAALGNMYGIGYTHTNASFISLTGASGWGMYVAADGDARIYLGGGNGAVSATGNITAYASDGRLKTNVATIENAIDKVKKIRGVTFDWVDNITSEYDFHPASMHETGVIAQEIQEVIPDAVVTAPFNGNYTRKSGTDHNFLTVDKDKIVPLLIEAIKEQQQQIEELQEMISGTSN